MDEPLARVAAGDTAAFESLYRELAGAAFAVAYATLRDSAQAEEVTQEVFLELWRTADRYEAARGTAARWVRTIARNRAIDRIRTVEAARSRDQVVCSVGGGADGPEELVLKRFERRRLVQAIKLLRTEHRDVIALTYFGELTQNQVAATLGIPLGTVKSRLYTALRHLRRVLGALRTES